jgi:hypothetical protein
MAVAAVRDMEAQKEQNQPAAGARRSVHHHSISYDPARWAKPGQELRRVLCQQERLQGVGR